MKLIITGASGFIGKRLVSSLTAKGYQLLLVGRNAEKLAAMFPDHHCCSYDNCHEAALDGFTCCLHLATRNSDQHGTMDAFKRDNVEALESFCHLLMRAGVKRHLYMSSILADAQSKTPYGQSKWQAEQMLDALAEKHAGFHVQIFRPAFIHALPYRGKLAALNKLPPFFARLAFQMLTSLKTSLPYEDLSAHIEAALQDSSIGHDEPMVLTNKQNKNLFYAGMRALFDYAFAFFVLLFFGWLVPILVLCIRASSPGPAFFVQNRIGKGGKLFPCYKFRTMHLGTKQAGTHEVSKASVTRLGAFLRSYKIDELPQVLNILRGEISFVGPRPCLPVQTELILERERRGVLDVMPGITGFAQVNDVDMSDPERLARFDAQYIARRTLILDMKIIVRTFLREGSGDRVKS